MSTTIIILLILLLVFISYKNDKKLHEINELIVFYLILLKWSWKQDKENTKRRIIDWLTVIRSMPIEAHDIQIKAVAKAWGLMTPTIKGEFIDSQQVVRWLLNELDFNSEDDGMRRINKILKDHPRERSDEYIEFGVKYKDYRTAEEKKKDRGEEAIALARFDKQLKEINKQPLNTSKSK